MRVKNILVTNKSLFIELLIKELINSQVSYVQIENEFHFEDKIFRFFDKKEYQEAIAKNLAAEITDMINIEDYQANDSATLGITNVEDYKNPEDFEIPQHPQQNKKIIKKDNKYYNQQIKRNSRRK